MVSHVRDQVYDLFFFKNASFEISFDTIIAVFTDFEVDVTNFEIDVTDFDANFEIGENSNICIKTDFEWNVFEKK